MLNPGSKCQHISSPKTKRKRANEKTPMKEGLLLLTIEEFGGKSPLSKVCVAI
jgi:hypothetical protein